MDASTFVRSVHAFTGIGVAPQERQEARDYLENLKKHPKPTIEVCVQVLSGTSLELHIKTFAFIALRQAVLTHWQFCDDNLRRVLQATATPGAPASTASLEAASEYDNWLQLVERISQLCLSNIKESISVSGNGETYTKTSAGEVALHLWSLITRKLLGLSSMFPKCSGKFDLIRQKQQANLTASMNLGPTGNADCYFSALLLSALVEECTKLDRVGLLNFRIQDVLNVKRFIDTSIHQQCVLWAVTKLSSVQNIGVRTALIQVLVTLLTWDSGARSNRATDTSPHAVHLVKENVARIILPSEGNPGLISLAIQLEHELINSPQPDPEYLKALGDLFNRLACLKFSASLDQKGISKQTSMSERYEFMARTIYVPFMEHVVSSADYCVQLFISSHQAGSLVRCKTALQWLSLKLENLYCLILNPDCKFTLMPHSHLLVTIQLLVKAFVMIKTYNGRDFADEWIAALDLCLKCLSYLCWISGSRYTTDEVNQLPAVVAVVIQAVLCEGGWKLLEVSDAEEEFSGRAKREHEEIVQDDGQSTQEGLSSVLRVRGFQLNEDDRYCARIGMVAEIGRICLKDTLMLVAHRLVPLTQGNSQTDDDTLDYIRFLFYFSTALLTDENKFLFRSSLPPELTSLYYETVGAFKTPQGYVPWPLRRPDQVANGELENTVRQFFMGILRILEDQAFFQKLSDITVIPCLVFLTRITKTYALKPITVDPEWIDQAAGNDLRLHSSISSSEMAKSLATGLVQYCVMCLTNYSGNANVIRLALLALGTICRADSMLQPHMSTLPVFRNGIVANLTDMNNPKSMRAILQPKDLTKLVEIITLATLPLYANSNDEENLTQAEWLQTFDKQREFLDYIGPCLRNLPSAIGDEAILATTCSIIRGVIRAYTRVTGNAHIALVCLRCLVQWLFNDGQWIPDMCSGTPGVSSPLKMTSDRWLEALTRVDSHMNPETYSQICALIKLTFSVCFSSLTYDQLLPITQKIQQAIRHQLSFIQKALIATSSTEDDSAERVHWLRSMIVLLKSFVSLYQGNVGSGGCQVMLKNTGSISMENMFIQDPHEDDLDHARRTDLLKELIQSTAAPFVRQIVEASGNSDLISVTETEKVELILAILHMSTFLFNTRDPKIYIQLSTPLFAQYSVNMAGALMSRSSSFRKSDAEEFLAAVCYNLITAEHLRRSGDTSIEASVLQQVINIWLKPLQEQLAASIIEELREEESSSVCSTKIFNIRVLNDFTLAVLALSASYNQALENFISGLTAELNNLQPRAAEALRDTYAKLFYDYAQQMFKNQEANAVARNEDSRLIRYRMLMLSNQSFCDTVFGKFLTDCRFSRWSEY